MNHCEVVINNFKSHNKIVKKFLILDSNSMIKFGI